MRVGILPIGGKQLHDRIISLRDDVLVHKTSLTISLFIEVTVPIQKSGRSCIGMLEYRLCLFLQLWCLTVMYLYDIVSSLSPSIIVMFDGHVFVCWSIDFASFYNFYVWRSCICMLEYRFCLLLQLWCLTVMHLYVRVSSLPPSTIVMFDVGIVLTVWYCNVLRYNCSDGVVL